MSTQFQASRKHESVAVGATFCVLVGSVPAPRDPSSGGIILAGVGYVLPDPDKEELPKGAVLTGGGRVFTRGFRHRGFVELSCGPLARGLEMQDDETVEPVMIYGPSLLLGYQHVAKSGLTLLAAGGVGYARWAEFDRSFWSFELRLGVGHTWR
jgi:hypothetical protein